MEFPLDNAMIVPILISFGKYEPGSGKTTDAKYIADNHAGEITSYSTGELILQEIESGSVLGQIEKGYVEKGDLIPTSMVLDTIFSAIKRSPTDVVILDGFPRKEKQLTEFCDVVFGSKELEVISVIEVRVGEETAKNRYLARGGKEEVFSHAMEAYTNSIKDIEDRYADKGLLTVIDGEQKLDKVVEDIEAHLRSLL